MAGLNTARQFRYLQTKGKIWIFSVETLLVMAGLTLIGFVLLPRFVAYELMFSGTVGGALTYVEHRMGQTGILLRYIRYWFRADHHHPGHASPDAQYKPRVYAVWRFLGRR